MTNGKTSDGKKKIYWTLFTSTFALSAFTFGGGYVIVSLMKKKFVDELGWFGEEEMLDLTAIAQSAPGMMAVNAALLIGYRMAGPLGGAVAVFATVLPPLIIISVISLFYNAFRDNLAVAALMKGMQAGVAAVIADVVISMGGGIVKKREPYSILVMAAAFLATAVFGVNVVVVILTCAILGAVMTLARRRKGGDAP